MPLYVLALIITDTHLAVHQAQTPQPVCGLQLGLVLTLTSSKYVFPAYLYLQVRAFLCNRRNTTMMDATGTLLNSDLLDDFYEYFNNQNSAEVQRGLGVGFRQRW